MEHFSVVIVNWNAGATLRACLRALFASEGAEPNQVILVDNASTDGSLAGLASAYPAVEIVQNAKNVGFARAVNQGLRAAWGQLVLVLNPDVILLPSAVPRLLEFMANLPGRRRRGPEAPGPRRGGARLGPPGPLGPHGSVRTIRAADPPVPRQPREPARVAGVPGRSMAPSPGRLALRRLFLRAPDGLESGWPPRRAVLPLLGGRGLVSPMSARSAGASTTSRRRAERTSSASAGRDVGWARPWTST